MYNGSTVTSTDTTVLGIGGIRGQRRLVLQQGQPNAWEWHNLQFPNAEGYYLAWENMQVYQYRDHLGSPRVTVKADGTVLQRTVYYPFGQRNAARSTDYLGSTRVLFSVDETGLAVVRVRLGGGRARGSSRR